MGALTIEIGRVLWRGRRPVQGPPPPWLTDRPQNVLQLVLRTPVRLVLALAVQPVRMNAPVVATEELRQVKALRQQPMDLVLGARLNAVHSVALREGDHQREARILDWRPKVLPCYS